MFAAFGDSTAATDTANGHPDTEQKAKLLRTAITIGGATPTIRNQGERVKLAALASALDATIGVVCRI